MDIPVFHDDQHGTAIVVTAGLINAYRFLGKNLKDARVVVNGAGAAGSSICKMIKELGVSDIIAVDKTGILNRDDIKDYNELHKELAEITNINNKKGTLSDALEGSDIFIGVSAGNILKKDMVKKMNKDAVIFAMANPVPEIMPEDALEAGAVIVGTGRSDYPNQINNVLAFPGLFKGALEAKSKKITEDMKIEAAKAIAYILNDDDLKKDYIIPDVFDKRVVESVAEAVKKVAVSSGICR